MNNSPTFGAQRVPLQQETDRPSGAPAGGGLLAQLKRQAEAKQATDTQNVAREIARLKQIDQALRAAYRYLNELSQQLNVLKPAYPGAYPVGSILRMENLAWQLGRADYRRQPGTIDDLPFERVSLQYVLSGSEPIVLDKSDNVVETTRKALLDFGVNFELAEVRNPKGFVERGRFTVQPQVKTGLLFFADYSKPELRLRTMNVQRFGTAEYLVPAEALSEQSLEEIALLILGESSQFLQRLQRA